MDENIVAEPYKIKVVEPINLPTREKRTEAIREAGYNTFLLQSDDVYIDLLTDSGTSAMSDNQWAGMMLGDEAYAGSRNFVALEKAVREVLGYKYVVPTHQGRAAEHILAKVMVKQGDFVPRNMYFTTSKQHVDLAGGTMTDAIIDEAHDPANEHPFKGNIDINKLEKLVKEYGVERIPYVNFELTVNMAGGQPVSLENVRKVKEWCDGYGIPIVFDATRSSENAFFIKEREKGCSDKSVLEILNEMMSNSVACTYSAKKDALVNIGGFIATNDAKIFERCRSLVVVYEGLHTYGGLAGRDLEATARGLIEGTDERYLRFRIEQVRYLGGKLIEAGVPIVVPVGGHAVFIDAVRFLPHVSREQFPAQTLAAAIYEDSGVRAMERGAVSKGRDKATGENIYPKLELVRLT
ncbi:MAG: tryptophanase, partial [Deltaproteobacteria bacterium]|nr:tryptophanase [Deltaproteobacteria bacterium]